VSRFVEGWPDRPVHLPLARGALPPVPAPTGNDVPVHPDGRLSLSASQLETYEDCPLRYAYQYVLRVREDGDVSAALGSIVHEVLAEFCDPDAAEPAARTLDGLLALAETRWRDDVARYRPQVEQAHRDMIEMLTLWWEEEG